MAGGQAGGNSWASRLVQGDISDPIRKSSTYCRDWKGSAGLEGLLGGVKSRCVSEGSRSVSEALKRPSRASNVS